MSLDTLTVTQLIHHQMVVFSIFQSTIIQTLIDQIPALRWKYKDGETTPLHLAAERGHLEVVQWLCSRESSLVGKRDEKGWTALHLAVVHGHVEVVKWIGKSYPEQICIVTPGENSPADLAKMRFPKMAHWLQVHAPAQKDLEAPHLLAV
jgi:hypothetical protein